MDRGLPAGGASGHTAGYIRCHYANLPEAHFAVESWRRGRALARIVGGADFAASPLLPFAVDREARGQTIGGEHEYEWGSFAGKSGRESTSRAVRSSGLPGPHFECPLRLLR